MHPALMPYLSGIRPGIRWSCEKAGCGQIYTFAGVPSCGIFLQSCALMELRLWGRSCCFAGVS